MEIDVEKPKWLRSSNMTDSNRMVQAASGRRMRIGLRLAAMFLLLQLPWLSVLGQQAPAKDRSAEPDKFYREYAGLSNDQIASIHSGKAVAKIIESPTPDEVFVFGSVYVNSTPESYLKFAFGYRPAPQAARLSRDP